MTARYRPALPKASLFLQHVVFIIVLLHLQLGSNSSSASSSESDFKLTGRKAKWLSEAAAEDPEWHRRAWHIPLYPLTTTNASSFPPIAYGGILASFTHAYDRHNEAGDLQLDSEEIQEMVAFACRQGLFATTSSVPTAAASAAATADGEEESCRIDEAAEEKADVPSSLEILAARRLLCEVVLDGPMCEQVVHEVVFSDRDDRGQVGRRSKGRRKKGWVKGPSTGSLVFLEVQDHADGHRHHVTVSRDSQGHLAIFQHSSFDPGTTNLLLKHSSAAVLPAMTFLSYNVWHNQPGSWVYQDRSVRWRKYMERMAHLAAVVWASKADVVGLQEVRYDQTFGPPGNHFGLQHLLELLAALDGGRQEEMAEDSKDSTIPPSFPWNFMYVPAMTFFNNHNVREDEGVALLSRFPIRRSAYKLLPRDYGDAQDGHQRICLLAELQPRPGGPLVGVYVTHFSLSAPMREAAAASILEWAAEESGSVVAQVLLADLNAEPQEQSVQMLTEAFRDAWVEMHPQPMPTLDADEAGNVRIDRQGQVEDDETLANRERSEREGSEKMAQHIQASFTFPTCQPVKRIDYVLFRGAIRPVEARLCGREATAESKDRDSPGGGMLEYNGPVFASDHLAVMTRFEGVTR